MSNNLIRNMTCPACGQSEAFESDVIVTVSVTENEVMDAHEIRCREDADCQCLECGHEGKAVDFWHRSQRDGEPSGRGTGLLSGMVCRDCGCTGPFWIDAASRATLSVKPSPVLENFTWDNDSPCVCSNCQVRGRVADFK